MALFIGLIVEEKRKEISKTEKEEGPPAKKPAGRKTKR